MTMVIDALGTVRAMTAPLVENREDPEKALRALDQLLPHGAPKDVRDFARELALIVVEIARAMDTRRAGEKPPPAPISSGGRKTSDPGRPVGCSGLF